MEKYKRYYGLLAFIIIIATALFLAYNLVTPNVNTYNERENSFKVKTEELNSKKVQLNNVQEKIKKIKDSITGSQKKIYSPIESDLGNDTIFFTLYNDLIEMIHGNSVKIRNIEYTYNPESDAFVEFGKDVYFVCDVNMELVSNYRNLGKLIEDIYQYPYYIRINNVSVRPYQKDKRFLITNMSLRLYAHTSPDEEIIPKETEE